MALAENVIDLPRLRDAVGVVGNEQDTLLTGFRSSAIALMERKFGRCIIDRPGWVSEAKDFFVGDDHLPDFIGWKVSDVKAGDVVINYVNADDPPQGKPNQTLTIATTDARCATSQDDVLFYSMDGTAWVRLMRYSHPVPTITVSRGIAATEIPTAWGDACALYVRALMDGSAYDDLGNMTALNALLSPWTINHAMATARTG